MSSLQVTQIEYVYGKYEEANLLPILKMLETEIGGKRKPYGMRGGAIDLVTFLEIVISFVAGVAIRPVISKYFEGFFNADALKKLGEKHRQQIINWSTKLQDDIEIIIKAFERAYKTTVPITFQGKPEAVAICIHLGLSSFHIVLNHENVSPKLMRNLPKGVILALRYLAESSIPKDATALQLYFDKTSHSWKYLFMPTPQAFGRWIDRYVDLDTGQVVRITSQKEFIDKFKPSDNDQYKFLVDPFREVANKT